jgi:hypothetical protein
MRNARSPQRSGRFTGGFDMKYLADWWGIQLVADNEDEKVLLKELYELLQNPSIKESYEDGDITLFENWDEDRYKSYHLERGDFVLELQR